MHQKLSIAAVLFYLVVALYHPLVMVTHIGMHAVQSSAHQQIHTHQHNDDGNPGLNDTLIHSHGEPENYTPEENLKQLIFQCIVPALVQHPADFKLDSSKIFNRSHSFFAYYPNRHTPPPQSIVA